VFSIWVQASWTSIDRRRYSAGIRDRDSTEEVIMIVSKWDNWDLLPPSTEANVDRIRISLHCV